ncbi:MAG: helix-turn-helix transcriptional regulator [Oscillatoriales cyanobacterium SM2_2_1]|nr:helix-turn-helix transcriptional regulator [Oscillatoriales cyanobacterium SM2_2_1]
MIAPNDDCSTCPIHAFKMKDPHELRPSEAFELASGDANCYPTSSCLSDFLVTPQGKPTTIDYPQPNVTLYQNGKNQPFASCLVIWQACHLMTKRTYHQWRQEDDYYMHEYQGRSGTLVYRLPRSKDNLKDVDTIDIRVVLVHLFLAACATQKSIPWTEEIIVNDRIIAEFLGLDRRKNMSRVKKLLLIESLMRQACELQVEIHWQQKGKIESIDLPFEPLWSASSAYHMSRAEDGSSYLSGLSFRVLAGHWSAYFLNQEGARNKNAYYQYGWLPVSLPPKIMNLWQRHEGAVVMLLHFLFRLRVGQDRSAKVSSLLKLVYGDQHLQVVWYKSDARRKVITTFESDLEQLFHYGLRPLFEDSLYPEAIQPWWVSAQNLPNDPEEALTYWTEEAWGATAAINSKKKWTQLLNASITITEFPNDWRVDIAKDMTRHKAKHKSNSVSNITGDMIKAARLQQGVSQRQLSCLLRKSQSWIRDIESGRYKIKPSDVALLTSVLDGLSA